MHKYSVSYQLESTLYLQNDLKGEESSRSKTTFLVFDDDDSFDDALLLASVDS